MNNTEPVAAKLMISHSWGGCLYESLVAVLGKCTVTGVQLDTPVWFCTFAQYQPGDMAGDCGPTIGEQLARDPFRRVIETRPSYGMLVIHTSTAEIYNRLWCVYEVNEAKEAKVLPTAAVSIDCLMKCMKELHDFDDLKVKTGEARCFSDDDANMITEKIGNAGGFEVLDLKIWEFRCSSFSRMVKTFHEFMDWGRNAAHATQQRYGGRRHSVSDPASPRRLPLDSWQEERRTSEPQTIWGRTQSGPADPLKDDSPKAENQALMTNQPSSVLVNLLQSAADPLLNSAGDPLLSVRFLGSAICKAAIFVGLHCLAPLADAADDEATCSRILEEAKETLSFFNSDEWELPESVPLPHCFDKAKFGDIPDTDDRDAVIACLEDLSKFPQAVGLLEMGMGGSLIVELAEAMGFDRNNREDLASVKEAFAEFDEDGDTALNPKEFGKMLEALNPDIVKDDIDVMFGSADQDQDGTVTFNEFLEWLAREFH
jgi:hypothetical protein